LEVVENGDLLFELFFQLPDSFDNARVRFVVSMGGVDSDDV